MGEEAPFREQGQAAEARPEEEAVSAKPNGRPTALTPEVQDKILNAIRAGNYAEQAAQYAGVHKSTYYRWMQKADEPDTKPIYREFRDAVKEAEAGAEAYAVAMVRQAMPSSWQAAMTFLERKYPERMAGRCRFRRHRTLRNARSARRSCCRRREH
jgi:transposase